MIPMLRAVPATMLMALSASVMKADGKVLKIELDFVKRFFASQFGNRFTSEHLQILKNFLDSDKIPLQEICADIRTRMPSEVRVQLIHYLFSIAKADGDVAPADVPGEYKGLRILEGTFLLLPFHIVGSPPFRRRLVCIWATFHTLRQRNP